MFLDVGADWIPSAPLSLSLSCKREQSSLLLSPGVEARWSHQEVSLNRRGSGPNATRTSLVSVRTYVMCRSCVSLCGFYFRGTGGQRHSCTAPEANAETFELNLKMYERAKSTKVDWLAMGSSDMWSGRTLRRGTFSLDAFLLPRQLHARQPLPIRLGPLAAQNFHLREQCLLR